MTVGLVSRDISNSWWFRTVEGFKVLRCKVNRAEISTLFKYYLLATAVIQCCVSKAGPLKAPEPTERGIKRHFSFILINHSLHSDVHHHRAPSHTDPKPAIPELCVLSPVLKGDVTQSRTIVSKSMADLEFKTQTDRKYRQFRRCWETCRFRL